MTNFLSLTTKLSATAVLAMFALGGCATVITAKQQPLAETAVATAAPADSDNDGVPDDQDACPDTRPGAAVDHKGCEIIGTLENAHFEFDSAALTSEATETLNGIAEKVKSFADRMFEVAGHTDSMGSDDYNITLGEKRAISVVEYLGRAGVSSEQLTIKTYGESKPVASNDTDDGRAKNRRVEVIEISN